MSGLRTVVQAIEDAASSSKTGYRFVEEQSEAEPFFTHGGIERASARFGAALQALGCAKGDRVALILPDNADFIFAFLGAIRAGVVPVPIYPPTGLGKLTGYLSNTLHIVARSGASLIVTTSEIKKLLGTVQAKAVQLQRIATIDQLRSIRQELKPVKVSLDDTCFLQFTSGSTSQPKGVVLTHANLAANVRCIMEQGIGIQDGVDSAVSWLPLYHDMGLIGFVLAPIYHRNTVTFLPPLLFLKRPARWLEAISRQRATISFGPNFAYALCVKRVKESELQHLDLSQWRVAGCGAEPIRAENLRAFADKFSAVGFRSKAFMASYGMAESTLAVSFSRVGGGLLVDTVGAEALSAERKAVAAQPGSTSSVEVVQCGPAFEGHEVRAFAEEDTESLRPLGEREVGELRLRGPSVTPGYYDDAELTRSAFAGGWLKTGDLGYLADGNVHVCGRLKEVIIVNGRNYYPQDLEWEASKVDGVRKGNVIAFGTNRPQNDRERVVVAFETQETDEAVRASIKTQVRGSVQQSLGLTVDDVIAVMQGALPKTSSGKLQRNLARELYEQGDLLDRTSARSSSPVAALTELAKSQLGYVRHALLGGTKPDER